LFFLDFMKLLRLSWVMLARDWRAGELRLLLLAVVLAVAALSSVGFFANRLSNALSLQARQLLGADAVLVSDNPISLQIRNDLAQAGLKTSETISFPSMVGATGARAREIAPQLASLKVVSTGYPLRGQLRIADTPGEPGVLTQAIPPPGTVWLDGALLNVLQAKPGDNLEIGELTLRVDKIIVNEPDRGTNFASFAPRAMINMADLEKSRLIQVGSRVTYRLLIAGTANNVQTFVDTTTLARGQRFEDVRSGRPETRTTLNRAEQFLSLVALLSALIAATAIGLAARRFAQRHLDGCAVMRAMGMTQSDLVIMLMLELFWVALLAAGIGLALGFGVHFVLISLIRSLLTLDLPDASILPGLKAAAAGVVLLMGFAGLPILRLAGVTPLRVLRRDLGAPKTQVWISAAVALLASLGLLVWFSGDIRVAAFALGGFVVSALLFAAVAWGLMKAINQAGNATNGTGLAMLRLTLSSWAKRGATSVAQMVALAIALMALLLLTVTRNDLLTSWRAASPADAPNRFLINVQPDQRDGVLARLQSAGLKDVGLAPMVRGRIVKINDVDIKIENFSERARATLDRELNLSYMDQMPSYNKPLSGRWINPQADEISVEETVAQSLGLKLDDTITFDIAGQNVKGKIVGLRKVAWDSMKVNFFMILSPALLLERPQTFISALHVPVAKARVVDDLVREYPNVTVFDTDNIVRQVQTVLDQVSRAVELLFVFTLLAGLLVLYAAQTSGQQERQRETALLRALGASRQQLQNSLLAELLLTGGIAGLMASVCAVGLGAILANQVFQFSMQWSMWPIVGGVAAGAFAAAAVGWWQLKHIVQTPPMISLRQE
jgi:putative ABC transport system permease protein